MSTQRIMYVCSDCADANPEGCGHYDRTDLAVMPNGDWLCEGCWEDLPGAQKWKDQDDETSFFDMPSPPEYTVKS